MLLVSSWTSHGLTMSTSSALPLPQHILQAGTDYNLCLVLWRFCVWVDVPVPLLADLSGHRKWPVQASFLPLLGDFTRGFLVELLDFPLHWVSISHQSAPRFQSSGLVLFPSISPTHYKFPPTPIPHAPAHLKNLFSLPREIHNLPFSSPSFSSFFYFFSINALTPYLQDYTFLEARASISLLPEVSEDH